ncbi:hypothetical protein [Pseudonocardia yunnanensis]|uniref:Uncharacterized protein n=1 Tax=Pseudonocardia yunnanensis TaxID=58107 RepID=A0ABW4F961_9PSEU
MTDAPVLPGGGSPGVAGLVLVLVLLVGVVAGRTKRRWALLLTGLLGVLVFGVLVIAVAGAPDPAVAGDRAAEMTAFYTVVVPLLVAFAAGWSCGRAGWIQRVVVVGVAALVIAAFPYAAAGRVTADTLPGAPVGVPGGEQGGP